MDLLEQTKVLIKQHDLKPNKLKGQNFCVDQKVIDRMVVAAKIDSGDLIMEVGPGFGFLTTALCRQAKQVIAVELDADLFKVAKKLESFYKNLKVIKDDVLKIKLDDIFPDTGYKIVANLPYSITSAFLKKFLTYGYPPKDITLLLQQEVAERVCARPGAMSLISVSVQLYGRPAIMEVVAPDSFWPKPKVNSAIIKISDIHRYGYDARVTEKMFWRVVRSGFSGRRKQLHNNLKNSLHLDNAQTDQLLAKCGIDRQIRAQELSVDNWLNLAETYANTFFDAVA